MYEKDPQICAAKQMEKMDDIYHNIVVYQSPRFKSFGPGHNSLNTALRPNHVIDSCNILGST